jgi:2-dehydropantoate 2-reductase
MRILVVGAGAIGGYFGGRLLEAKRDVTFLVRPRRAAELARSGLAIRSPLGNVDLPAPPTVQAEALDEPFDLILLGCKAYDLDGAMQSFAPAVGANTAILPVLNGIRHLDVLDERFGAQHVFGGQCLISASLDPDGRILHLNDLHTLSFGERGVAQSARGAAIAAAFSGARFEARLSAAILQEMWEKWVLIATGAGISCLMRATIGDVVTAGGAALATRLVDECAAIAAQAGFPLDPSSLQKIRTRFTMPGSGLTASMLRDIEIGAPIEADHILGDLLRRRGAKADGDQLLAIALTHVKAYEARRAREHSTAKPARA